MLRMLSESEVEAQRKRVAHLYASKYRIDNLTAILMDHNYGKSALDEDAARAKAHGIEGLLKILAADIRREDVGMIEIPEDLKATTLFAEASVKADGNGWVQTAITLIERIAKLEAENKALKEQKEQS